MPIVQPVNAPPHADPAEQRGYLRYFYRNWRPTRLARIWIGFLARLSGLGLTPRILATLQVKSRDSDRLHTIVLAVAHYEGARYLVSMLGNGSEWVQNVRAAKGHAFLKRWRLQPVILVEIPPQERAPILKAWCQVATSGRQHLPIEPDAPLAEFAKIAADHPVFRIDSASD